MTTAGITLNTALSNTISPSRLLQAQCFLELSDKRFEESHTEIQIGPKFTVVLYTSFSQPSKSDGPLDVRWQETFAKSDLYIKRVVSASQKFSYVICIDEDLNDGRYHEETVGKPTSAPVFGKKLEISLQRMSLLCYTVSGRLLNISQAKSPVLALQLTSIKDVSALDKAHQDNSEDLNNPFIKNNDKTKFHQNIDWIALEKYFEVNALDISDSESEDLSDILSDSEFSIGNRNKNIGNNEYSAQISSDPAEEEIANAMHSLKLEPETSIYLTNPGSLSLLEYLLRLCSLQELHQISCLEMTDSQLAAMLNSN